MSHWALCHVILVAVSLGALSRDDLVSCLIIPSYGRRLAMFSRVRLAEESVVNNSGFKALVLVSPLDLIALEGHLDFTMGLNVHLLKVNISGRTSVCMLYCSTTISMVFRLPPQTCRNST